MQTYFLVTHAKNIASYRSLERRHPRWRTIRRLFGISIDEATFFVGAGTAHTPASLERRAKEYFATLRAYDRLERTNNRLRQERMRKGLSLGEAAFLFADSTTARPIPNRLRAARLRTGLSQADVAECIGMSRSRLSYYERGKREPGAGTALTLALLYGIPLERLFRRRVRSLHTHMQRRENALAKWRQAGRCSPAVSSRV
jgi:DNA-binding XRE family transcriptional regulator